jgi:2-hydroxychromene-2-carboxylate isomerase
MKIDKKNPDLTFYFSFQCPYSYMVWHLLIKMLKKSELTVAPIEIGNSSPGNTKYHFREIWSDERWARLIEDGKKLGLRINQPSKYVSALQASRALEVYEGVEIIDYITSVFRGVFFTGVDISQANALRVHLQSEGIDSSGFSAALETPSTLKAAEENLLLWGHNRIRTVPTLEFENERYSGFIEESGLERYLRAILD